jgi:hypothetical protein
MSNVHCEKAGSLTKEEKRVFTDHLERQGLSDNVWDLFAEWVARSTPAVRFFYLKVYVDAELVGLGLLLRMKPFDLRSSYSTLRTHVFLNRLAGRLSALMRNCVYVSFRNLITSNLTRPFFYSEPGREHMIMKAILGSLKEEKEADMITIIDTATNDRLYQTEGFCKYPCSSEAYLDAARYKDISEYLREHPSLKRNLSRKKGVVVATVQRGPMSDHDKGQMKTCVECSVENSRVNNPCQKFFEEHVFETEVFNSDKYIHICTRVDEKIAGFHTFQVSGSHMGGVLGGFNREYSQNHFLYERVIVASLDYAIKNDIRWVHYSLIDNQTKLRLVESIEPCGLYFFSRSALNRRVFALSYKASDVYALHLLETQPDARC